MENFCSYPWTMTVEIMISAVQKPAFVSLKHGAIIHLSYWQKTKVCILTERKSISIWTEENDTFGVLSTFRILCKRTKSHSLQSAQTQTATRSKKVNERKERQAWATETALWLWLEGPCHPECMPVCWKLAEEEGQACDHFTEMSRMFGHSSVLNKHHWSLHPSLPPCLQCWLRQNIYECLCVGLPMCTPTDSVYQQAQCWGLSVSVCACLIICLNVYIHQ